MSRPELQAPPEIFYNEVEAKKYASNTRMMTIQTAMTERAVELLNLPKNQTCYLLDIGCGSGLSGEVLSEQGHIWVGTDISPSMLGVAVKRDIEGDVICSDMGQGMFFRSGVFDGAISISALQWLCNADKREHIPQKRLKCFFQTLYNCLARGARAVFQFYPQNPDQMSMITEAAMRCGFSGGLVVDFPNSTKAKKYYLCLFAGEPNQHSDYKLPRALDGTEMEGDDEDGEEEDEDGDGDGDEKKEIRHTVEYTKPARTKQQRRARVRAPVKSREWVLKKKDRQRAQGKKTARDSKYAARRRPAAF